MPCSLTFLTDSATKSLSHLLIRWRTNAGWVTFEAVAVGAALVGAGAGAAAAAEAATEGAAGTAAGAEAAEAAEAGASRALHKCSNKHVSNKDKQRLTLSI